MDLQGKVIAALPERKGTSARGEWVAQDFVIETHDSYPRKLAFTVFGADRLQRFNIQIGQEVMVSFDIDAHEYQGRWYNSVRAFDVRLVDPNAMQQMPPTPPPFVSAPFMDGTTSTSGTSTSGFGGSTTTAQTDDGDDLPF